MYERIANRDDVREKNRKEKKAKRNKKKKNIKRTKLNLQQNSVVVNRSTKKKINVTNIEEKFVRRVIVSKEMPSSLLCFTFFKMNFISIIAQIFTDQCRQIFSSGFCYRPFFSRSSHSLIIVFD
jgi:hypothetical protein